MDLKISVGEKAQPVLTGYTIVTEEPTLPAIVPVRLNGQVF